MFENFKGKEDYGLMWECLKRSEYYMQYCKWRRKKEKNPDLQTPKKFRTDQEDIRPILFNYLIDHFPIHSYSFDDWWDKHYKKQLDKEYSKRELIIVRDYSELIENDIDTTISALKHINKREPTLQEFKKLFLRLYMKAQQSSTVYLKINIHEGKLQELIKKCGDIIKSRIKKRPRPRIRRDEIMRYLKVYDMHKAGASWDDIYKKLSPRGQTDINEDPTDSKRVISRDFQKAKELIKNAELTEFPVYTSPHVNDK